MQATWTQRAVVFVRRHTILLVILLFAAFFRFYQLGQLPAGLAWDEAAIGYNGYSIMVNGTDEWLKPRPISFRSFGDYKAPLAIYVSGAFTHLFGLTPFGIRLPFAVSGVAAVIIVYCLLYQLLEGVSKRRLYSLAGAFLITFSPWHIHFTRVAFESGMALTFLLAGVLSIVLFLKIKKEDADSAKSFIFSSLATLSLVASLYTYHSAKIVTPLLTVCTVLLYFKKDILAHWKSIVLACVVGFVTVWPLAIDTIYGNGAERAEVLIFAESLSVAEYFTIISSNLFAHLSPSFLFFGATDTLRHGTGSWGVLLFTTYLLAVLGLGFTVKYCFKKENSVTGSSSIFCKIGIWSISAVLIGLLPAVLTHEVPHPNRALLAVPGFLGLAVVGLDGFLTKVLSLPSNAEFHFTKMVLGTLFALHIVLFISFWQYYLTEYPHKNSAAFQEGYLAAFSLAKEYERGENGKPKVAKIIFSSEYDHPYIYALLAKKTHPHWYQGGSLVKYEFTDKISEGDLGRSNTLVVLTQGTLFNSREPTHLIRDTAGNIRFAFYVNVE